MSFRNSRIAKVATFGTAAISAIAALLYATRKSGLPSAPFDLSDGNVQRNNRQWSADDDSAPQLACVVMSLHNQPTLVSAVQSLLAQDEPVEIVVVNSGGGDPEATLREAGIHVRVVNHEARLFPGAVRNLGIRATHAPYVAFLAGDCLAAPGWVRHRLALHQAGALAVSTPVTNASPRNLYAWASYIALFARRMPDTPADQRLHYGVSYARTLFDQFGLFREEVRAGEDLDFNERVHAAAPFAWARDVHTAHRHPTTALGLLRDQYARGERMVRVYHQLHGTPPARGVALNALRRFPTTWRLAWKSAQPHERRCVLGAAPLMLPAAAAYSLGALSYRPRETMAAVTPPPAPAPDAKPPRILALLVFHNEMRWLPDYFANVAPQVDGIIALDDGSTDGSGEYVEQQPSVLELVRLPPRDPHVWNEPLNRRLIIEAAYRHQPDWLVVVDADERLEREFRQRAAAEIARAEREGHLVYGVKLREMWDYPDSYRIDGIWGRKSFARLFKARPADHVFDTREFHGYWPPLNSMPNEQYPHADLTIYHLKMMRWSDRKARQERYQRLDPNNEWQAIGYDYLTDEIGLRLEQIPPERAYEPLESP